MITLLLLVRATYFVLRTHPVRGESRIQRNANRKVATLWSERCFFYLEGNKTIGRNARRIRKKQSSRPEGRNCQQPHRAGDETQPSTGQLKKLAGQTENVIKWWFSTFAELRYLYCDVEMCDSFAEVFAANQPQAKWNRRRVEADPDK